MKTKLFTMLVLPLFVCALTVSAQQMIKRTDVVWARATSTPITLDGKMTEAAWASADSIMIVYGKDNGMPGSGWRLENGVAPTDSTRATVKFLTYGDTMYVGVICPDSSIGGGLFNKFDGLLMNLRDRSVTTRPVPAVEHFYGWVTEPWADSTLGLKGKLPGFGDSWGKPRPDSLKARWDAVTVVKGTTNDDATPDTSWTTELKFNLGFRGYDVTKAGGDIVMFSMSIYDADWQWPLNNARFSGNRTWAQCPWGNASNFSHLRVFARPDVTTSSGPAPAVDADLTIRGAGSLAAPTIDGKLTDAVWSAPNLTTLRIKYGDAAVRAAYPKTAPYRSGQFQPTINGVQAAVTDPGDMTVKMFYKADSLYFGFDVKDKIVQSFDSPDRYDGIRVTINPRDTLDPANHNLPTWNLTFRVGPGGATVLADSLQNDTLGVRVKAKIALNSGTTVDTVGTTADSGYTAEMRLDLTKFGYPAGRGDGVVFLGIMLYDGDSFTQASSSYGTRTWFMREKADDDGPAWVYLDPKSTVAVGRPQSAVPYEFVLLGNYPNPFNPSTTIRFTLPGASEVTLTVFDILGRVVAREAFGVRQPGLNAVSFNAASLASGVYTYRLKMEATSAAVTGKMMLVK